MANENNINHGNVRNKLDEDDFDTTLTPNTQGRIRRYSKEAQAVLDGILKETLSPPPLVSQTTTTSRQGRNTTFLSPLSTGSTPNISNTRLSPSSITTPSSTTLSASRREDTNRANVEDYDDDDGLGEEIDQLHQVEENLSQELSLKDVETMRSDLLLVQTPALRYRYNRTTVAIKDDAMRDDEKQDQYIVDDLIIVACVPILLLLFIRIVCGPIVFEPYR